jgi:hypothetical protein
MAHRRFLVPEVRSYAGNAFRIIGSLRDWMHRHDKKSVAGQDGVTISTVVTSPL